MNRFATYLAVPVLAALSGCGASGPDPALQAENQQLKQTQAAQASELQQVKAANDALQGQLSQIQQDLAAIRTAAEAATAAQAAASAAAPATATPADAAEAPALVQANADAPTSVLKPSGADESKTLEPGWIIETFPMKRDHNARYGSSNLSEWKNFAPPDEFSLGSFINPPSPIKLLAHRRAVKGENHVQYQASGYFPVQNRGGHVFVLTIIDKSNRDRERDYYTSVCNVKLALENDVLIDEHIGAVPGKEFSVNGGANLVEGLYKASFVLTCPYVYRIREPDLENLSAVSVSIAVRRPGDSVPVEFGERDIVYVAQH